MMNKFASASVALLAGLALGAPAMAAVSAAEAAKLGAELTPLGGSMCPVVHAIRSWAETNAQAIEESRAATDPTSGPASITPTRMPATNRCTRSPPRTWASTPTS